MPGNSFGQIFRITTFGESHGKALGVVIDGCPSGLEITVEEIQAELDRRKPGTSRFTTSRQEKDQVEILSGIFQNKTLGTPIALLVYNHDHLTEPYEKIKDFYRPGHAETTWEAKYGIYDWRGGGRASARETIGRVAAGAFAKKILAEIGIKIFGYITRIGKVKITSVEPSFIESNPLRCPDPAVLNAMMREIDNAKKDFDSVGGIIEIVAKAVPAGFGEPVFHKLSADLAHAFFGIPAVKGFEIGDGFAVAGRRGSENNDQLIYKAGRTSTATNHAGGIVGGISNGEDIIVRFALKPTSSIAKKQQTINKKGEKTEIQIPGRHDPCVCPRAVAIGEAMMALTLVDHYLLHKTGQL